MKRSKDHILLPRLALLGIMAILFLGSSAQAESRGEGVIAIENGRVEIGDGRILEDATVLIRDSRIEQVGKRVVIPAGALRIDAKGKVITPGLVDTHSHMGVYPLPGTGANSDGNEMTGPIQARVRAVESVDLSDPSFKMAWLGGVTTVQILPGSGNLVGGQSAVFKTLPGGLDEKWVKDAPLGIKMAFGENPKRVYGGRNQSPSTRMGSIATLRDAFLGAQHYREAWLRHAADLKRHAQKEALAKAETDAEKRKKAVAALPDPPKPPKRDLNNDALVKMLEGQARIHAHSYRVDDFHSLFRLADEFGLKVGSVQHALEAWKVPEEFKKRDVSVVMLSDMWGYKHEANTASPKALAVLDASGVRVAVHTDHPVVEQRYLMHEAARALRHGLPRNRLLRAVSLHHAVALGMEERLGTLEKGRDADVVVWSGDPALIATRVDRVIINGIPVYDRHSPKSGDPQP
jgi:imidazolonepropionase-like amidohydrolase